MSKRKQKKLKAAKKLLDGIMATGFVCSWHQSEYNKLKFKGAQK